jgi:hypothetical protein
MAISKYQPLPAASYLRIVTRGPNAGKYIVVSALGGHRNTLMQYANKQLFLVHEPGQQCGHLYDTLSDAQDMLRVSPGWKLSCIVLQPEQIAK